MVYKGGQLLRYCSAGSKSSLSCLMKVVISFQDGAMSLRLLKGYMFSYNGIDKANTTRSPFYKSFNLLTREILRPQVPLLFSQYCYFHHL